MAADLANDLAAEGPPSTAELHQLALAAFGRLARRDLSHPEEIWAEDAVDHFIPVGDAVGRDAIVAFFAEMFAAIPDFSVEILQTVAEPPFVVVQWRITGTFTGAPFQGVRATGRPVDFSGCDVVRMDGTLVSENWVLWDGADFARQIGLLPPAGSVGDRALLAAFNALTFVRTLGGRRLRKRSGSGA